ncbi:MAG: hypothetical protein FJX74_15205 [Armatimonadetes bacterium]|nr:hypothetical protein [Armatimonadota bacterium]
MEVLLILSLAFPDVGRAESVPLVTTSPDAWQVERRGTAEFSRRSLLTEGKLALWRGQEFADFELRGRVRIAEGVEDGAAWVRFRYRDDGEHYALGLRGRPANDLFLFRFGPRGGDRALALEPLGFELTPGQWYDLQVACVGGGIEVTLNNEPDPRLSVVDATPIGSGRVGVGGGYRAAEYTALAVEELSGGLAEGERAARRAARDAKRAREDEAAQRRARVVGRAACRAVVLPKPSAGRQTIPLDGTWLFLPEQERDPARDPRDPRIGDGNWCGVSVPGFWTPRWWWLYGPGEGASELWVQRERARVGSLGFAGEQTHAGWYRQWITIPKAYEGKRLVVQFGAVAMVCEVFLNGTPLGGHKGMFGSFELELPPAAIRWSGRNLLTAYVADGAGEGARSLGGLLGAEATAGVSRETLDGLPRGMYSRSAGIWQPVALIATEQNHLADVVARTRLDGLDLDVSVAGEPADGLRCRATVADRADGAVLVQTEAPVSERRALLAPAGLAPKPWTPDTPNLYDLRVELLAGDGRVLDVYTCRIGFRTFEVRGNRLYLNGRPYWLRGANHAPSGLEPNSPAVARDFLRRMREGNTVVLRAHASSFTETWLDAADEVGIGVSMEGIWPWVMIDGSPPPSEELQRVWEDEWIGLMRRMRNHPSILMWTLNNESYWYRAADPGLRRGKWEIATRLIRAMRETDPTRPVVCDSGYVRDLEVFEQELQPNGFDDGDLDDTHLYAGWYAPGPWSLYPSEGAAPLESPFSGTRPAISQEFSTGYPNNDTGHPTRKYITDHLVAQTWVGDFAYEDRDPAVYLRRHAWMAKELTELARRHRSKLCGLLHFSNSSWFRLPYDPEAAEPYPVYDAMKPAMAPVLVSADLRRRHVYAGDALEFSAVIVNDSVDGSALPPMVVQAELLGSDGRPLSRTAAQVAPVPYYENRAVALSLAVPASLPTEARSDYRLALTLKAGESAIARNEYPLIGATRAWAGLAAAAAALSETLTAGEGGSLIANGAAGVQALRARPELQAFVQGGGHVLVLNGGEAVRELLPDVVAEAVAWRPEVVNVEDEASPLLDGLEPWDVCWLNAESGPPAAATGGFRLAEAAGVRVLATAIRPHGYLASPADVAQHSAVVVFEVQIGKGRVVVSELHGAAASTDPVAARLVRNLVAYVAR